MSFDTLERTSDLEIDGASQGDLSEAALGDETETESVGGASVASRVASPTPPPQHLHAPHVHSSGEGEREGGGGGLRGGPRPLTGILALCRSYMPLPRRTAITSQVFF